MRATYIEQTGPPDVIRYGELPDPVPGPTDVLVEVLCTTVNPVDALIRAGWYRVPTPFPFVVGRDLVGRVAGEVNRLMAGGRLRTRRTVDRPLAEMAELHRQIESGELRQRVVINVSA